MPLHLMEGQTKLALQRDTETNSLSFDIPVKKTRELISLA